VQVGPPSLITPRIGDESRSIRMGLRQTVLRLRNELVKMMSESVWFIYMYDTIKQASRKFDEHSSREKTKEQVRRSR